MTRLSTRSCIDKFFLIGSWISGLCLIAIVLLVGTELICRNLFHFSLLVSDEFSGYLLVGCIAFGMSSSFREGSFLRVDFIYLRFRNRVKRIVDLLYGTLSIVFVGILCYQAYRLASVSFLRGSRAPTLADTPLWIPQAIIPIGFGVLLIALVLDLIDSGRR